MRASRVVVSFCVVLVLLGWPGSSAGLTFVDPMTWEQLILKADFVGVVQCEVAGGIVARYKVLETWKGALIRQLHLP